MPYLLALQEAEKAARDRLAVLRSNAWHSRCLEAYRNKLPRSTEYLDPTQVREMIIAEGVKVEDAWVLQAVNRLNLGIFTNAVCSDDDRHDQAVSHYFRTIIPEKLHHHQDIINMFLEIVARWAMINIRWTTNQFKTTDILYKMKVRIGRELSNHDSTLYTMTQAAFMRKYGNLTDTTPLRDLFEFKGVQKAWYKVLPDVLDIIDDKVDHQGSTSQVDVNMPCSNVTPVPATQSSHPRTPIPDISSHAHHRYPTRHTIRQQQHEARWRTWRQGKIVIKIPSNMEQSQ